MALTERHAQQLYAAASYYRGAIDGVIGPASRKAIAIILANAGIKRRMSARRQMVAAAQAVLNAKGYAAGVIDGYDGHNTMEALTQWLSDQAGTDASVDRTPRADFIRKTFRVPHQRDCSALYGNPETEVPGRLQTIDLPYAMRLDWNLRQKVKRVTLHKLCAPSFVAALADVVDHYGEAEWRRLGLDRYAGGYVKRRMRGGRSWSMHAYGCAVDIYAAPNGLRTRCPDALFCRDEYQPFLDIMERHQWLPAIRLWGADAMHFQQARV